MLVDNDVVNAFIKMHVGFRVWVEWGIGGLKRKWKKENIKMLKQFDCIRVKYISLSKAACYLTNQSHRQGLDFTYHVGECNEDEDDDGWDNDLQRQIDVHQVSHVQVWGENQSTLFGTFVYYGVPSQYGIWCFLYQTKT